MGLFLYIYMLKFNYKIVKYMNQLQIKKIFIFALVLNLILGVLSQVDYFWNNILGYEGLYAGIASATVFLFILVPASILLTGIFAVVTSKTRKVAHFFTAVGISLGLSIILIGLIYSYNHFKDVLATERMYQEDQQLRPVGDVLRPVTIITPSARPYSISVGEAFTLTALAHESEEFNSSLPVKFITLAKSATSTLLNREITNLPPLTNTNERSPDGRLIFSGTVTIPKGVIAGKNVTDTFLTVGETNEDLLEIKLIAD